MHQACRLMSSSRCGPRRALILGEDQAMMVSDDLILRDFHLRRLCASQTPEKTEIPPLTRTPFVEQFALSRYYSSVQPLYESHVMARARRKGIEIAPASDFGRFRRPNPSPASIFSKNSTFRHHGCMHQGCWSVHSSGCGPRRALILGEDQAMIVSGCLFLRDFHMRRLCASQTPEKTEMPSLTRTPFVE